MLLSMHNSDTALSRIVQGCPCGSRACCYPPAVAIASFSILMSTVPASYFGMNLHSGWEVSTQRQTAVVDELALWLGGEHIKTEVVAVQRHPL